MRNSTVSRLFALAAFLFLSAAPASAQFATKWVAGGDFHNWYAASGSEIEEGLVREQQYGARWPGIYSFTDMQAAKGLWLGATNVTDEFGTSYPIRVAHVGPRASGVGEVFPTRFELLSRFPLPAVTVDGDISFPGAEMVVDATDPDLPADIVLESEFNTILGVTVQRRVLQFSQDFHDDYHVIEYVFTNTGNTDDDPEIELPNQTLTDFFAYLQYRLSVARETRYVIGNATGWGINAMNDARGDGVLPDPPGENFRAQFTWHGRFPSFGAYDNLGGPIAPPALPAVNIATSDTLGRLGATQFIGVVTLHADAGASDEADDPGQPSTTNWIHSDDPYLSNNDPFNASQMATEYNVMTEGNKSPRHAYAVEPSGEAGWLNPTRDPSAAAGTATSGGYSFGNGYGPYTLGPGESVRIVIAEGAGGLSREANTSLGQQFKDSGYDSGAALTFNGETKTKNEWVFTSRDSLFQTFRRALANYAEDYAIPRPPAPPTSFNVRSGGDRISLDWEVGDGAGLSGFEIYRAQAEFDSTYTLIHTAGPGDRSYDDLDPIRGVDYYYYIQALGNAADNDGAGDTPGGVPLRSSRYYTQAYLPARLQREQGTALDQIRIVPNPYYIGSDGRGATNPVRFPDQTDKLAFFNIPGFCRIDIYTELGELVDTIIHDDGSGDEFWDHTTSSRQVVASGIYIAVITVTQDVMDNSTGDVLFQQGERAIRKFVIVR
ncbi:MAG: hypothetical protein AAGI52_13060 [Bacteroidota bacterium]